MFEFLRTRLRQGTPTVPLPGKTIELPDRFRGLPVLQPAPCENPAQPPTGLITGDAQVDVGACLFAPEEAGCSSAGIIEFSGDYRLAASTRTGLVSRTGEIELARALGAEMRRLFGRSLRLRSVVAGSCAGCEAELVALGNVVFDIARFGVQFVASPRHADGIVITGVVNRNMRYALLDTYQATPEPRIVIAVGACAVSGGPFRGGSEALGIPSELPVDLYVPGCPPHPLTIADGILRLLGRMPDAQSGKR